MRILVETKTFEFAVIDQYNKSTYSAANTKAKTIKSCIDKFIDQFNLYDEQHVFWQPAEKKNARLLINNNDYGQLGDHPTSPSKMQHYRWRRSTKEVWVDRMRALR